VTGGQLTRQNLAHQYDEGEEKRHQAITFRYLGVAVFAPDIPVTQSD
jgi:hypothetical protein